MTFSCKSAAVTLTAAALLVVGVDFATFAATGDSLILGRINHEPRATTLERSGPGPALRLTSRGNKHPSLVVSSLARVRRLNADMVDGRSASTLSSNAVSFKAGSRGDVYPGQAMWELPVPPGIYQASFNALVIPNPQTPGSTVDVICGLIDLDTIGPRTRVYTADSAAFSGGSFPAVMSGAETVRVRASANPALVCVTSTADDFTPLKPLTATWTPINHRKVVAVDAIQALTGVRQDLVQQFTR